MQCTTLPSALAHSCHSFKSTCQRSISSLPFQMQASLSLLTKSSWLNAQNVQWQCSVLDKLQFFFTVENESAFSILFPNYTKLGTRVLCICESCFCFPILLSPKGFLVIRFQSFIMFLNKRVNYFVSWFAFIRFNLSFILRHVLSKRKWEWRRAE